MFATTVQSRDHVSSGLTRKTRLTRPYKKLKVKGAYSS